MLEEALQNTMKWYAGIVGESLVSAFFIAGFCSWLLAGEVHARKNFVSLLIFVFWAFFAGSIVIATVILPKGSETGVAGAIGGLIGALIGSFGSQGQGGNQEKKN